MVWEPKGAWEPEVWRPRVVQHRRGPDCDGEGRGEGLNGVGAQTHTSILVGPSTPFGLMFHFFSFLIRENQFFFWFRLELFAILPFFHQVAAHCEAACTSTLSLSLSC